MRNAVLAKAYGDSGVLTRLVESMDDNMRNVSRALMMAAPPRKPAARLENRSFVDVQPRPGLLLPRRSQEQANWSNLVKVPKDELKPGDLIVYIQSRVYDVFEWEGEDILVYPGNWIMGVADSMTITDAELRRYERDEFDDAPHVTPVNLRGPAAKATGESIRKFFERRGLR